MLHSIMKTPLSLDRVGVDEGLESHFLLSSSQGGGVISFKLLSMVSIY